MALQTRSTAVSAAAVAAAHSHEGRAIQHSLAPGAAQGTHSHNGVGKGSVIGTLPSSLSTASLEQLVSRSTAVPPALVSALPLDDGRSLPPHAATESNRQHSRVISSDEVIVALSEEVRRHPCLYGQYSDEEKNLKRSVREQAWRVIGERVGMPSKYTAVAC